MYQGEIGTFLPLLCKSDVRVEAMCKYAFGYSRAGQLCEFGCCFRSLFVGGGEGGVGRWVGQEWGWFLDSERGMVVVSDA